MINEKGLLCEERDVSMPLTEHKEPWFMRLNLGEEVPVFIHGDTIVSDYNQIIDYIETNFVGGMADKPLSHDTCRKIPCLLPLWQGYPNLLAEGQCPKLAPICLNTHLLGSYQYAISPLIHFHIRYMKTNE